MSVKTVTGLDLTEDTIHRVRYLSLSRMAVAEFWEANFMKTKLFFLILLVLSTLGYGQSQVVHGEVKTPPEYPAIDAIADGDIFTPWDISVSGAAKMRSATALQL